MIRIWSAAALVLVLAGSAIWVTEIDTDVRAVLGDAGAASRSLDTREGRTQIIAVSAQEAGQRHTAVERIATVMRSSLLVASVSTGPSQPEPDLIEALWRHRFALAPPRADAFNTVAMVQELTAARKALSRLEDAALAQYYLRDPTGSFRRVIDQFKAIPRPDTDEMGFWLAKDGRTNLIVADLTDGPFDSDAQASLDAAIQNAADRTAVRILGPRSITARVSREIAWRSQLFGGIATALLLIWLVILARSPGAIFACLLPLAAGLASAVLVVTGVFGGIHVIALGFGATLLGLAMDYPLHLMAHGQSEAARQRAVRLILIGAATTAIAFLALTGTGVPVLAQMGVLVAVGLLVSAIVATGIAPALPPLAPYTRRLPIRFVSLPNRSALLLISVGAMALGLFAMAEDRKDPLIALPPPVSETISTFRDLMELPSGQIRVTTKGQTLREIAERQRALIPILDGLERDGVLCRYEMLGAILPDAGPAETLPTRETLAASLPLALERAGFKPSFAADAIDSYEVALKHAAPSPAALGDLMKNRAIASLLHVDGAGFVAPVRLYNITDPELVAKSVSAANITGVAVQDAKAEIGVALDDLKSRALAALSAGIFVGFTVLLILVRRARQTARIALACAAATVSAAALSGAVFGGFSIIQIVALALIVGIAIDYAVFTELVGSRNDARVALHSVMLCAVTTLIAFITLSFSGVSLLEEIGLTVSAGVVIMLGICMTRPIDSPKDRM
ncbi:MAG: MMPL family transporter [Pseudomonadota bacterium]